MPVKSSNTKKKSSTKKSNTTKNTNIKKQVAKRTKKKTSVKTTPKKSDLPKLKKNNTSSSNSKKVTKDKVVPKVNNGKDTLETKKEILEKDTKKEVVEKDILYEAPSKEKKADTKHKRLKYVKKKSNAKGIANLKRNDFLKKVKRLQRKIKIYGIGSVIPKKEVLVSILLLICIFTVGYGISRFRPPRQTINLESVSSDIDSLKTLKYDISSTSSIIKEADVYTSTLKEYYEYDFKEFNILDSYVEDFKIYYNAKSKESFMVFKATSGNETNLTNGVEKFYKEAKITYSKEEYDGYIFYISSSDNKKIISKIKQCQVRVFDVLQELNKEEIKNKYGISSDLYSEYKVKTSMIVKQDVTEYLIFYPKNDAASKKIEELMNTYYSNLEDTWKDNEDNYNLIENRYTGNYNGYLIYIISKDNDLVLQLVKR